MGCDVAFTPHLQTAPPSLCEGELLLNSFFFLGLPDINVLLRAG